MIEQTRYFLCVFNERSTTALSVFTRRNDAECARERYESLRPFVYAVYDEAEVRRMRVDMRVIERAIATFDAVRLQRGRRGFVPLRWLDCALNAEELIERAAAYRNINRDEVITTLGSGNSIRYGRPWYARLRLKPDTE